MADDSSSFVVPDSKGLQLIVLHADKNLYGDTPYVFDGKPYYKLESTTMQMPQQMYNDMLRQRDANRYRWDYAPSHLTIADLDERRIRNAVSMGVLNGRLNAGAEAEPEWEVENGSVKIVFWRSPLSTEANDINDDLPKLAQNLTGQVKKLIISIRSANLSRKQVMQQVKLASVSNLVESYLNPAMEQGLVKMLYPDSPRHPKQKYLLTDKGLKILELL